MRIQMPRSIKCNQTTITYIKAMPRNEEPETRDEDSHESIHKATYSSKYEAPDCDKSYIHPKLHNITPLISLTL